jgi:hypothetical protein
VDAENRLQIRVADVRFALDELERRDRSDPQHLLTGRLDTSRVGIFGHSFGGAVAAEVCRMDARFKAGIDLDGFLFGESLRKGIGKPFLVFSDHVPNLTPAQLRAAQGRDRSYGIFLAHNVERIRCCLSEVGGWWLTLRGASHMNFCDSPLYSPWRRLTNAGSIRRERAMEIVNAFVVSFFQTQLNGKEDGALDALLSRYPEVERVRLSTYGP